MEGYAVPGYEDVWAYADGSVRARIQHGCMSKRKFGSLEGGYRRVRVNGKRVYVHWLVCCAFHGPPPSSRSQVNHIDLKRSNNRPENLEWVTPKMNLAKRGIHKRRRNARKVVVVDIETGQEFVCDSTSDAAQKTGASHANVSKYIKFACVCRGRWRLRYADAAEEQDIPGEEWRAAAGMENTVMVSTLGRAQIRHGNGVSWGDKFTPVKTNGHDYAYVGPKLMHRVMLETFVGPAPPGHSGDHINRKKADNRLCNLRWATFKKQNENRDISDSVSR